MPGASRSNRIGIKGSEDLGNGMKAIYQVEFGVQDDRRGHAATWSPVATLTPLPCVTASSALTGDWGTFVVGRNDTPFKTSTGKLDLFADTMADYNGTDRLRRRPRGQRHCLCQPEPEQASSSPRLFTAGGASTAGCGRRTSTPTVWLRPTRSPASTAMAHSMPRWPMNRSVTSCSWTPATSDQPSLAVLLRR
ncbi:MAG: porin [Chromatiales bacterium]|nr:porin [Chromatiales bacterium]